MATYWLTIGGATKDMRLSSLRIAETANGRNELSCQIMSMDGAYRPALGAEVILTEDAVRIFGGTVRAVRETGFGDIGWTAISNFVTAVDFNEYADRRFVTLRLVSGTLKAALQALVPYLSDLGVTLDAAQVDGPTLDALVYDFATVTTVLNDLASTTGYTWEIDYNKKLKMTLPASTAAPFNLTAGDGKALGDVVVEPSREDYANRVYVRFTEAAMAAWGFLSPTSIANGETVTIGSVTYTFQTTLVNAANNVQIAGSVHDTLQNLVLATEASDGGAGEGTAWGAGTIANSAAFAYMLRAGMLKAIAREAGTSGNTIAVTDTLANGSWYWEGDTPITNLTGGLEEALTNSVQANSSSEQSLEGLWEVVIDAPEVRDYGRAQELADAELARRVAAKSMHTVSYVTEEIGLHPGQTQTITLPLRNLSGTHVITDVEIFEESNWIRRRVTAQGGDAILKRWQDDAKKALSGSTSGGSSGAGLTVVSGSGATIVTSGVNGIYMGGSDTNRTRIVLAGSYYRATDAVDIIVDSTKLPSGVASVIIGLNLKSPGGGVSVQAKCVSGTGDWSNEQDQGSPCAAVTATDWYWTYLTVPIRTGTYAYRVKVTSNTSGADVWMQGAMMQW